MIWVKDCNEDREDSDDVDIFTIVSCVRWRVCVFDPICSGASLRLSVYV